VTVGIGFVGAGAIIKKSSGEHVRGLTTAASVWLTAGVGVAAGLGRLALAVLAVVLALVILTVLQRTEGFLNRSVTPPERSHSRD
jgi:putative Mg2+ transporter-C (MgtC) family protein